MVLEHTVRIIEVSDNRGSTVISFDTYSGTCITATQGTGQKWPLYTGGRYIQVIVLIPKRYQRSEMNIKFLEIQYLK